MESSIAVYEPSSSYKWIQACKKKSQKELIDYLIDRCEIGKFEIMEHLRNVQKLTGMLAKEYNKQAQVMLDEHYIENIIHFSILHDIGKFCIPKNILNKPASLNEFERKVIEMHPLWGWAILREKTSNITYCESINMKVVENIILYHHEKWDGTGYPYGLKGCAIPLEARIVAIVDVYDALTAVRPYKKAWSKSEALHYIVQEKGKHFDPSIVDILVECI
ncbi:HD-GYP domain-containing protein [Cytobacillus gottheilii]|uniref:HD-GYP domain-containing protein n=1 Tax=Cytobacillus gottheilii TaxID=859144 RepID=UPI0009BBED25|nr:HD domain-containing phosphohydrolase [Cytobacillus gottheilii]